MMQHSLEKSRFFSLIAWVLILSLSFFTYTVAKTLKEESGALSSNTNSTVKALENINSLPE